MLNHPDVPCGGGDEFSSDVQRDGTFAHQFDRPGTYDYRCTLHGGMTGTVIVGDTDDTDEA